MFHPEPVYTTSKALAQYLRDQIASGNLAPGDFVPSERDLMERHDLGREAVRRAVRELRQEGLIELVRGEGWVVRESPERQVYRVQRGSLITARMPTPSERQQMDIPEGVPVVVVAYSGRERLYPADRWEFTTA